VALIKKPCSSYSPSLDGFIIGDITTICNAWDLYATAKENKNLALKSIDIIAKATCNSRGRPLPREPSHAQVALNIKKD